MKKLFLVLLLLASPAFAVREYYSVTRSMRALGMGGAFYGLSDDAYALFYNPAGLDLYRGDSSFMMGVPLGSLQVSDGLFSALNTVTNTKGKEIGDLATSLQGVRGKPVYVQITPLTAYFVHKHFGLGFVVGDTKMDLAVQGQDLTTSLEATLITDAAIVAGYANTVYPGLHVGANLKVVGRGGGTKQYSLVDLTNKNGLSFDLKTLGGFGVGIDADVGAIYDLPWSPGIVSHVSLTLNNLLGSNLPLARQYAQPPALTRMVSLGASTIFPGWGPLDNINVILDIAEIGLGGESNPDLGARGGSLWKHVNLGAEFPMRWFVVRAGLHQGDWTLGAGIRTGGFDLEAATYGEELMSGVGRLTSRRYGIQMRYGFGNAPPPPLAASNENYQSSLPKSEEKQEPAKDANKPATDPNTPPGGNLDDKTKTGPDTKAPERDKNSIDGMQPTPEGAPSGDIQSVSPEPLTQPATPPAAEPAAAPTPAAPEATTPQPASPQ